MSEKPEDPNPPSIQLHFIQDRTELNKILNESRLAKQFMQKQLDDYKVFIANAREFLATCRSNTKEK